MRVLDIRSRDELRRVDHKAVLAWEAYMREGEHAEASTVRRRLAALSSLFKHLVKHGVGYYEATAHAARTRGDRPIQAPCHKYLKVQSFGAGHRDEED